MSPVITRSQNLRLSSIHDLLLFNVNFVLKYQASKYLLDNEKKFRYPSLDQEPETFISYKLSTLHGKNI
ncbi:MAG TPA: hypothetical protein DCQ26_08240 [Marinilabiliales bacterium]|nr:MAG: hypothetical protein A2W95_16985 [Bacteroidetes bacterium GWA2_40_14]OFZ29356.1 MAG: hypothetical protein A2437_09065 [Bacteroidetes bacterium RIFOXYC2_FULL_40_12]HAM98589.1 hypothetical protein [Marinilabiliales bacterium]HAZ04025.1 hypothetical protein [Marinilabiliales bacterium]